MQLHFVNIFQIFKISILMFIIFLVYILLKHFIIRQYYNKILPSLNVRLIDILGILHQFPYSYSRSGWNGYSNTTYMGQFSNAFFYLFKKERLYCVWISIFPFICLNSPDAIEEVMNKKNIIEKTWFYNWLHCWLGTGLLTSSGAKWKSRRKLLTPAFHFDILKDFLPIMNEKSMQLVKTLGKGTTRDFTNIVEPVTLCSLDIICETTLGVNIKAQENGSSDYVKAVERFSHVSTQRIYYPWCWIDFTFFLTCGRSLKKDIKLLHDFTMSVIHEKKKCLSTSSKSHKPKRKALMDTLLQYHIETKEFTEEDIREEVDTFLFGGHDTTSIVLSMALYFIGLYRDIQANLYEELYHIFGDDYERPVSNEDLKSMNYLECVIKETLRLHPPVPSFARKAGKNMIISGYPIPDNSSLVICPYMLHRNEDYFPTPEKFDPERFTPENSKNRHPYAFLPFSAGARNCIGQRFAMLELKTILSSILRNYTLESLDPRDKVISKFEITLSPTHGIRIKIRPRHTTDIEETN